MSTYLHRDILEKVEKERPFYKRISETESLRWLDKCEKNSHFDLPPLASFKLICSGIRWFKILRFVILGFALIGFWALAFSVACAAFSWMPQYILGKDTDIEHTQTVSLLGICIGAFSLIVAGIIWVKSRRLLLAWVECNWAGKGFIDDVFVIIKASSPKLATELVADSKSDPITLEDLTWLIGIGTEFDGSFVPRHIVETCSKHLIKLAEPVKSFELGKRIDQSLINVSFLKEKINERFSCYRRFFIISPYYDKNWYYQEAEKIVRAEMKAEKERLAPAP